MSDFFQDPPLFERQNQFLTEIVCPFSHLSLSTPSENDSDSVQDNTQIKQSIILQKTPNLLQTYKFIGFNNSSQTQSTSNESSPIPTYISPLSPEDRQRVHKMYKIQSAKYKKGTKQCRKGMWRDLGKRLSDQSLKSNLFDIIEIINNFNNVQVARRGIKYSSQIHYSKKNFQNLLLLLRDYLKSVTEVCKILQQLLQEMKKDCDGTGKYEDYSYHLLKLIIKFVEIK